MLIQTYEDVLDLLIAVNKPNLNKCKPPLCHIINEAWKQENIDNLKKCILDNGDLHIWSSYKNFKKIIVDSMFEIYMSCDPKAYASHDFFIRWKECSDKAEGMFFTYRDLIKYKDISPLEYKLWVVIIPLLAKVNITQNVLFQLLSVMVFHYSVYVLHWLFKYYYKR